MKHINSRRESHYDKTIETACHDAGAVRTESIKAIISTVNPEWDHHFSEYKWGQYRYGLTGLTLHQAHMIERNITPDELQNPERCIRITARLMRLFVNQYLGYERGFVGFGLSWGSGLPNDVKQHYLYFCNIGNQPASYLPAEMPGVKVS